MKTPLVILGLVLLLGGIGLAVYGIVTNQAITTYGSRVFNNNGLEGGDTSSWSQSVFSGSWMTINIVSTKDIVMTVSGSVSGQLYNATNESFSQTFNFGSTQMINVKIRNPSSLELGSKAYITGSFDFQRTGTEYTPIYLILSGVTLCGGIVLMVYGLISKKVPKTQH